MTGGRSPLSDESFPFKLCCQPEWCADWWVPTGGSNLRLGSMGAAPAGALRHSEHAHLLSDIEKLTLPILGTMFPFWSPTGDLVCQLEATST